MGLIMIHCNILNEQINVKNLTFVEFGFGKVNCAETFKYEIKMPIEDFCNHLDQAYSDGIEEIIEDNKITGDFEPPYPGAVSYPTLDEFTAVPGSYLFEHLSAFHEVDILKMLTEEDKPNSSYVIRTIDNIECTDGYIFFFGRVSKSQV